jgi:hypothetical protein
MDKFKSKLIKMDYKTPKLIGKDEDGEYLGRIEEKGLGDTLFIKGFLDLPIKLFGKTLIPATDDVLMISNRHNPAWIFSLFTGYRQIGTYKVARPNNFHEGEEVIVTKKDDKIIKVIKAN